MVASPNAPGRCEEWRAVFPREDPYLPLNLQGVDLQRASRAARPCGGVPDAPAARQRPRSRRRVGVGARTALRQAAKAVAGLPCSCRRARDRAGAAAPQGRRLKTPARRSSFFSCIYSRAAARSSSDALLKAFWLSLLRLARRAARVSRARPRRCSLPVGNLLAPRCATASVRAKASRQRKSSKSDLPSTARIEFSMQRSRWRSSSHARLASLAGRVRSGVLVKQAAAATCRTTFSGGLFMNSLSQLCARAYRAYKEAWEIPWNMVLGSRARAVGWDLVRKGWSYELRTPAPNRRRRVPAAAAPA